MPRGFEGERESARANDPSGFSGGNGPSDNISTSPREERQDSPLSGLDAVVDQINRDIASGVNVGGDTYQNQMAQGILSGAFGGREEFGIDPPSFADTALSAIGYDPQQTFGQNVIDMVVPGRNTPLGALTSVPALAGAPKAVSGLASLANVILGKMNFRPADTGGITSGMETITEKYLNVDDTYTGRPDDAPPAGVVTPGSISESGFTTVAGRVTDTPPNLATETDAEFNARMDRMYGEQYERDRARELNQARIDKYLESQGDTGVFTPPRPPDPRYDERPLITMLGEKPMPESMGGFADPLLGSKTIKQAMDERVINEKLQRELDNIRGLQREMGSVRSDLSGVPNAFNTLSPRAIARKNLLSGRPFLEL